MDTSCSSVGAWRKERHGGGPDRYCLFLHRCLSFHRLRRLDDLVSRKRLPSDHRDHLLRFHHLPRVLHLVNFATELGLPLIGAELTHVHRCYGRSSYVLRGRLGVRPVYDVRLVSHGGGWYVPHLPCRAGHLRGDYRALPICTSSSGRAGGVAMNG